MLSQLLAKHVTPVSAGDKCPCGDAVPPWLAVLRYTAIFLYSVDPRQSSSVYIVANGFSDILCHVLTVSSNTSYFGGVF